MRRIDNIIASLVITVSLAGCDYGAFDNYDPPGAELTGQVVFDGVPVGVRSNGVQLELWQPSYELDEKIPVHVDQDGSFSAKLFEGDYLLNLLAGNGPWMDSPDTIRIQVRGGTEVEVPVRPYYVVEAPSFDRSAAGVSASFAVRSVEGGRAVEYVGLYISTTRFVDRTNMAVRVERIGADVDLASPVALDVELPESLRSGALYARVGIKTVGVDEMIFSPVQRLGS